MILVIDIGNTKISLGTFELGTIKNVYGSVYPKNISIEGLQAILKSFFGNMNFEGCIISSVVDHLTTKMHTAVLNTLFIDSLILSTKLDIGLSIKSNNPEKFGTDRIANAFAAYKKYKQRPIIVVDCGSATTFDIIDSNGDFIGGLIMPGIGTQIKSLTDNTALLPNVSIDDMDTVIHTINTETEKGILSGVVNGHSLAIQGLIKQCEKELKTKPLIIGTGGYADFIDKYMTNTKFDIINTYLTLEGIYLIYEQNMVKV